MDSRAVCENATATGGGCAYVPLRSRKFGEDFEDLFGALGVVEIALHHLRPDNHNHAWLVGG